MRKISLPESAVWITIACAVCSSGCKSENVYKPLSVALKEGQAFTVPCDGYFIDLRSAQKIAMEILMNKAEGEIE